MIEGGGHICTDVIITFKLIFLYPHRTKYGKKKKPIVYISIIYTSMYLFGGPQISWDPTRVLTLLLVKSAPAYQHKNYFNDLNNISSTLI